MSAALTMKQSTLDRRIDWHIEACDIDGVYNLTVQKLQDLPEPYRSRLIDNAEFERFALHNIQSKAVQVAFAKAQELAKLLDDMAAIESDERQSVEIVLEQYFYEQLYGDWRTK